jgi:hypothetical protein
MTRIEAETAIPDPQPCCALSDLESELSQMRDELELDRIGKIVQTGRLTRELLPNAVGVSPPEPGHTVTHPRDSGLDRGSAGERRAEILDETVHVSIRIRPQCLSEMRNVYQHPVDLGEFADR